MANSLNAFMENHEKVVIDTTKKMRVGIIGCGWIAEEHVISYKKQPDVEIVAGCDLIPGKARKFFEKLGLEGVKCYESDVEMLADQENLKLDAVSICTYNRQHAPCAIHALNAGLHVLLEKPFTVTTEEAVEVMRAERASGKVLSIGFQPRCDENMIMVKDIVRSGVLGDVYYIQTGGGRRRGIPTPFGTTFIEDKTAGLGALADIGCYSIDMVMNAIGYPRPLTVTGYKSDFFGKDPNYFNYVRTNHREYADLFGVDDFAAGFVRLEGGCILDFRIAWAMNIDSPCDTIFLGTKGGLRVPATPNWGGSVGGDLTLYHEVAGKQVETIIPMIHPPKDAPTNFDKKIRTFLDAAKGGKKSPVPTDEILYNQAILDYIAKSSDLGCELKVELPEF